MPSGTAWCHVGTGPAVLWIPIGAAAASDTTNQFGPAYLEAIYYPTYCRLDGLIFGVLLAAYRCFYPEHWKRHADPRLALSAGMGCILAAGLLFHFPSAQFVGGPALSFLGAVFGYPLFALGCTCLLSASLNWERFFPNWRGLVIYYASGIAVGALLWWLVENPFLRLRDRLLAARRQAQ